MMKKDTHCISAGSMVQEFNKFNFTENLEN